MVALRVFQRAEKSVKLDQDEVTVPRTVYNVYEAKTSLSKLVDRAAKGEVIVIAKSGKPLAKLSPLDRPKRRPGGWKGRVRIAADFDGPLPKEILAAFEGRSS